MSDKEHPRIVGNVRLQQKGQLAKFITPTLNLVELELSEFSLEGLRGAVLEDFSPRIISSMPQGTPFCRIPESSAVTFHWALREGDKNCID